MKTLVLGLGVSGKAAAAYLLAQKIPVIGVDQKAEVLRDQLQDLIQQGLILVADTSLVGVNQLILSPGIPLTHPLVVEAKLQGIEVVGEVEFACRHLKNRCIGITGSNGKTTTTLLVTHVLKECGYKARALGNVGVGLSSYLLEVDPEEILVIELSSFQLETLQRKFLDVAVILNILPNHLDRYPSMKEYEMAKLSIQDRVKPNGVFLTSYASMLPEEKEKNVQAAFAICAQFGIRKELFYKALSTFRKPPHRIERIAERIYNDSKSSNIASVLYALEQFSGPLILIVGGVDKGSSYAPWKEPFQKKVRYVIAYGAAREKIRRELEGVVPLEEIERFQDAVERACQIATKTDTLLLSPGCSSYDQFANFEHRGEVFRELIAKRIAWTEKKLSSSPS